MQAKTQRYIESGKEYDALFPKAKLTNSTVKRGATVQDTVRLIPQVVKQTRWQTKKLSQLLRGDSLYSTCRNIWDFVYDHIRYHKDDEGREQIRSPARSWHDRERGVDCDCYTVFISTILTNLRIPHKLRIAKYSRDYFQHIYPVVPTKDGSHITIDCVVDSFDHEEIFTEKKDTSMNLEFLEGLDDIGLNEPSELGKKGWFKKLTHNLLHNFNKFNPATVLLRNGVLACMKLNLFKVAQRLKYAYWSEAQAKAKGVDMNKWHQLVKVKDKLENIFFSAGGKPENFKASLLKGNGNRNHDVNGLGHIPPKEVFEMDIDTPLPQLLGKEIYASENSIDGFGDLGDPATGTAVAAATGVVGIIAEIINKIGSIFPKKSDQGSEDFKTTPEDDKAASDAAASAKPSDQAAVDKASDKAAPNSGDNSGGGGNNDSPDSNGDDPNKKQGFWEKNKKWLKPTLWGTAIAGTAFGGYMVFGRKKGKKKEEVSGTEEDLSGIKKSRSKHRKDDKIKRVGLS